MVQEGLIGRVHLLFSKAFLPKVEVLYRRGAEIALPGRVVSAAMHRGKEIVFPPVFPL
jgi:hypothetical protein